MQTGLQIAFKHKTCVVHSFSLFLEFLKEIEKLSHITSHHISIHLYYTYLKQSKSLDTILVHVYQHQIQHQHQPSNRQTRILNAYKNAIRSSLDETYVKCKIYRSTLSRTFMYFMS